MQVTFKLLLRELRDMLTHSCARHETYRRTTNRRAHLLKFVSHRPNFTGSALHWPTALKNTKKSSHHSCFAMNNRVWNRKRAHAHATAGNAMVTPRMAEVLLSTGLASPELSATPINSANVAML